MAKDEQKPVRVEYQRRNKDLDPQLVWRGKDEQDWSNLIVQAPPLYIQAINGSIDGSCHGMPTFCA